MEKNPYNPETEPASHKWWNEKPKEEKTNKAIWPHIKVGIDSDRNILHVTSHVMNKSGNLKVVSYSRAFSGNLEIGDFKATYELMNYETNRVLASID